MPCPFFIFKNFQSGTRSPEDPKLFKEQLEFATQHRIREPGLRPTSIGDKFAAFHCIEYGTGIQNEEIDCAWKEVEAALKNLYLIGEIFSNIEKATHLISQRSLVFYLGRIAVKAVPDLIAFYAQGPPLIIDWKVHAFATNDYRLQLACYAIALTRCKPHIDFPAILSTFSPTDIRLIEAQLLTVQLREYSLSELDIEDVENHISESTMEMDLASGEREKGLNPHEVSVTYYPDVCQRCSYQSLCEQESLWPL